MSFKRSLRQTVCLHIAEEYGDDTMHRVDTAVQRCVERERLYESIYAQVHWLLFVNRYSPQEVIRFFENRLAYFTNSKPSKFKTNNSPVYSGIMDTEWTKA